MTDAISRSAVLEEARPLESLESLSHYANVYVVDVDDIQALPALDVAPVVHARWQDHHCTNCFAMCVTARSPQGWIYNIETAYCPNCGARMDGEIDA